MQYNAMRLYCQVNFLHQECLMVPSASQYNAMRLYYQVAVLLQQECLMVPSSFSLTFTSIIKTKTNLKQDMTVSTLKQAPNARNKLTNAIYYDKTQFVFFVIINYVLFTISCAWIS